MKITIDTDNIAKDMIEMGINVGDVMIGKFDDWSNTIVDVLEMKYNLETLILKEFKKIHHAPKTKRFELIGKS